MKKKVLSALLIAAMTASMVAGCGSPSDDGAKDNTQAVDNKTSEKANVSLRMWGAEEDQAMLQSMIESFKENYKDVADFNIELGVESEADAKDDVLTDISAAADVYAFASDQLNDLVKAGALECIDDMDDVLQTYAGKSVEDVKNANASGSVDASSIDGKLYAFPMSADNGYFLLYDSSVLSEEDVQSWDSLLAAADKAGKKVGMILASGWYNASFFYGAGFVTELQDDGSTKIDWNATSEKGFSGVDVVKSMLDIAGNSAFMAIEDNGNSNALNSGDLCAIVSGTWDSEGATKTWGDNYAATKLPTFTLNGDQVQQGSVAGFKCVAVNSSSENAGWATLLADWITNEQNQTIRFEQREIGPSNIAVAESDAVAANIGIAALSEQSAYGVVQVVGNKYWDPTATFGENIAQGKLSKDDDAAIQSALDTVAEGVAQTE